MINTFGYPLCEDNNKVVIELQCTMEEKSRALSNCSLTGSEGLCDWLLPPEAVGLSELLQGWE